jgi:hypothetical protein
LPSENLHCACSGGLGRLLLSCADDMKQSAKTNKTVMAIFFMMMSPFQCSMFSGLMLNPSLKVLITA